MYMLFSLLEYQGVSCTVLARSQHVTTSYRGSQTEPQSQEQIISQPRGNKCGVNAPDAAAISGHTSIMLHTRRRSSSKA